jgi:hypothetical protein
MDRRSTAPSLNKGTIGFTFAALLLMVFTGSARAEGFLDLECGVVFTGYNDVRIPDNTGTKISLKNDISSRPALALRFRTGYTFGGRHSVLILAAPLTVHGESTLKRSITYQGKSFPQGTRVESSYRFDSYRLTYRYSIIRNRTLTLAAGLTGKIRSADIAIMSAAAYAHRTDLGAVPLINTMLEWTFSGPFSLLLDVDALVTPFGRAEDALIALRYRPNDKLAMRIGYRVLEGGADGGGNVYTFSLFHYATAGITSFF